MLLNPKEEKRRKAKQEAETEFMIPYCTHASQRRLSKPLPKYLAQKRAIMGKIMKSLAFLFTLFY